MNPHHYAVVVGIDRYPGLDGVNGAGDLFDAKADACRFYEWLLAANGGGLAPGHAALITLSAAEEAELKDHYAGRPIRNQVNQALDRFNESVQKTGHDDDAWRASRLYIYTAGHGAVPEGGQGSLLFADIKPKRYWGDPLDLGKYREYYERCRLFSELVFFSDCCREILEGIPRALEAPFGCEGVKDRNIDASHRNVNWAIGFGARLGREATELGTAKPKPGTGIPGGFFTHALMQALYGLAGLQSVDTQSLAPYLRKAVSDLARHYGRTQSVDFINNGYPIVLAQQGQAVKHVVSVHFADGWTGSCQLIRGAEIMATITVETPGEVASIELPNGVYDARCEPDYHFRHGGIFKVEGCGRAVEL